MKLVSLQFVFIFNGQMDRPDQKYVSINNRLNNLFDSFPTLIPYSEGMPFDFPVVQLKSSNGKYNLNMSKARCDFIVNASMTDKIDLEINDFKMLVMNINTELSNMKFSRVGMVGKYIFENKNPISYINEQFLKRDLSESQELRVRYNKRRVWTNTKINNVIDIYNAHYINKGKDEIGVIIDRDINTISELLLNVSKKEVDKFIEDNINSFSENDVIGLLK